MFVFFCKFRVMLSHLLIWYVQGESLSREALPNDKFFPIITSLSAKAVNALSEDS